MTRLSVSMTPRWHLHQDLHRVAAPPSARDGAPHLHQDLHRGAGQTCVWQGAVSGTGWAPSRALVGAPSRAPDGSPDKPVSVWSAWPPAADAPSGPFTVTQSQLLPQQTRPQDHCSQSRPPIAAPTTTVCVGSPPPSPVECERGRSRRRPDGPNERRWRPRWRACRTQWSYPSEGASERTMTRVSTGVITGMLP